MFSNQTDAYGLTNEGLRERVQRLSADETAGLFAVIDQLLLTIEHGGCALCAIDVDGGGTLTVAALGQQEMVPAIMSAMADIHTTLHTRKSGSTLQ